MTCFWDSRVQPTHTSVLTESSALAGTTIAAVHELEKAGVRAAFINAVLASADRSAQLAKL